MPSPPSSHVAHRGLAALGLAGTALITATTTIAAVAYEGSEGQRYSLLNHWVSELGEVAHSELAWLFNAGLIVGGPLLALSMLGLGGIIGGGWGGAIAVAGLVAGIAAAGVGLLPMDDLQRHALAALTFFFAAPVAVGIFTAWLLRERPSDVPRSLVWPGVLTVVASVTFLALLFTTGSLATPDERAGIWPLVVFQWLSFLGTLAWFAGVSAVLWQGYALDDP